MSIADKLDETANIPINVDLTIHESELMDLNRREIEIYNRMKESPRYMFETDGWLTDPKPVLARNAVVMLNGEIKNADGTTEMSATALHMSMETLMAGMQAGKTSNVRDIEKLAI